MGLPLRVSRGVGVGVELQEAVLGVKRVGVGEQDGLTLRVSETEAGVNVSVARWVGVTLTVALAVPLGVGKAVSERERLLVHVSDGLPVRERGSVCVDGVGLRPVPVSARDTLTVAVERVGVALRDPERSVSVRVQLNDADPDGGVGVVEGEHDGGLALRLRDGVQVPVPV